MSTNPTLPTLDGEPRELRDGDRVRTDRNVEADGFWADHPQLGRMYHIKGVSGCWWPNGKRYNEDKTYGPGDIVLILGPAEHDNGDGTVTKVCTIPVTLTKEAWDVGEPSALRAPTKGDTAINFVNEVVAVDRDWRNWESRVILRPKTPTPSPFEVELVRRLNLEDGDAEKVVLPPGATRLLWARQCRAAWCYQKPTTGLCSWLVLNNGPLPDRQQYPGPDTIQLDAVRRLAKQQEN